MLKSRLKELRTLKMMTQQEVANVFGISRQVYNNYELGKREPDYETIILFADYFETTTDYLLGKSNDPNPAIKQSEENTNLEDVLAKEGVTRKEDIKTIKRLVEMMALINDDTDNAGDDFIAKDYNKKQSG